jgi:ribosome-associated translation inhibitor RaiA
MIKVVFKKIEQSKMTTDLVRSRLEDVVTKFPDLSKHSLKALVYAENTSTQAGPDVFGVKLIVDGKKFKKIVLEKKGRNLYVALGDLCDSLLERLNRVLDKQRVKRRVQAQKMDVVEV